MLKNLLDSLDTGRLIKMLLYSVCVGAATGFTAAASGVDRRIAVFTGVAAFWTNAGAYWATSPKTPPPSG